MNWKKINVIDSVGCLLFFFFALSCSGSTPRLIDQNRLSGPPRVDPSIGEPERGGSGNGTAGAPVQDPATPGRQDPIIDQAPALNPNSNHAPSTRPIGNTTSDEDSKVDPPAASTSTGSVVGQGTAGPVDKGGRDSSVTCPDTDADGVCNESDNCVGLANPTQNDNDRDGIGNICDPCPVDPVNDIDHDGYCADEDNCVVVSNSDQGDVDTDGIGDACDTSYELVALSSGGYHNMGLFSNGTVITYGRNNHGQLGNGTSGPLNISYVPVAVVGLPNPSSNRVVEIDAGESHSVALMQDGTVWSWGSNEFAQLGNNSFTDQTTAVQVLGPGGTGLLSGIVAIASGRGHNLALKNDGTVWAWGDNNNGQLGNGTRVNSPIPLQVRGSGGAGVLTNVTAIAAGSKHSVALLDDGTMTAWGRNDTSQLCQGFAWTMHTYPLPVLKNGLVILNTSGTPTEWTDDTVDLNTGVLFDNAVSIAAGGGHTLAIKGDGTVHGCGSRTYGQLGDPTLSAVVMRSIGTLQATAVSVEGGELHTSILLIDGTVWSLGWNAFAQIGDGTTVDRSVPTQPIGLSPVEILTTGLYHTVVLTASGELWGWGINQLGQLGDPATLGSIPSPSNQYVEINPTPVQLVMPE